MRLIVNGIEHAYDDNGFCQIHADECSMSPICEGDITDER